SFPLNKLPRVCVWLLKVATLSSWIGAFRSRVPCSVVAGVSGQPAAFMSAMSCAVIPNRYCHFFAISGVPPKFAEGHRKREKFPAADVAAYEFAVRVPGVPGFAGAKLL